jgi:hypothetical protein
MRAYCDTCGEVTLHRMVAAKTFDWQTHKTVPPLWGCIFCSAGGNTDGRVHVQRMEKPEGAVSHTGMHEPQATRLADLWAMLTQTLLRALGCAAGTAEASDSQSNLHAARAECLGDDDRSDGVGAGRRSKDHD